MKVHLHWASNKEIPKDIDINSLSELEDLLDEYGECIIHTDNGAFDIEVYDTYVE